jgi:hypothetical protein
VKALTWRSVLDCPLNLASSFVALVLYVGLLGAVTLTIASTVNRGRARPCRPGGAAVAAAGRDRAIRDGAGRGLAGASR